MKDEGLVVTGEIGNFAVMIDVTRIVRPLFAARVNDVKRRYRDVESVQRRQFGWLLRHGASTKYGQAVGLDAIGSYEQWRELVPVAPYPELRPWVMRMINGEKDVLWPGRCHRFAQSSGTSDGKSKYIPITPQSLQKQHYAGSFDSVAWYLSLYPESHLFGGKALILGGSFANELTLPRGVKVGDLSAHLIDRINPLVNLVRVPSKRVALMKDWEEKLPQLVESALHQDVTNISGVPSWFLTVLRRVIERAGATTIHDVWPRLEVFFHGGIAFDPYREQYQAITDPSRMRYLETYNASEGFFAVQSSLDNHAMLLLLDAGCFYEFVPLDECDESHPEHAVPAWEVEQGKVYALVITACNGLWRYPLGDTVRIESVNPLKITIAGRTKHYINAFGEEVMVHNTDAALAVACAEHHCQPLNYTAAPVYTTQGAKGYHQWLIEWATPPVDHEAFAESLDRALQTENSDYQAKRYKGIFLERLQVVDASPGLFDRWLASTGKLGGQRKVPRLSNDRHIIDALLRYS